MWQRLIRSRVVVEDKMMSAKVRTILYAGGVAGLAVVLVQAIVLPAPRLACSEKKHDFGVVPFKGTVRHTFFLQNVGGRPLRFSNIETSCGCIKADLTKHVIKRDEPCELNVDLVLDDQPNLVSGRITIESNDPGSPKTVFSVTANPGHKLMISPSLIDMGTLVYGSVAGRSGEVEVLCREPKALSLQVEDIMSPSALWARLSNVDGPGRPRLCYGLQDDAPIGPLTAVVRLEQAGQSECVRLPVRGAVIGLIRAEPDEAYFGLVKTDTKVSKRIALLGHMEDWPIRAEVAGISPGLAQCVETSIVETETTTYLDIQLETGLAQLNGNREINGAVRLHCELGNGSEAYISIPVYLFIDQ